VVRSGLEESVHLGSVAVAEASGRLVAAAGDPGRVVFARSSMKPLQAAVSLAAIGEDLPQDEVVIMSASHNGEPAQVGAVRSILHRSGLGVDALQTPPARRRLLEDALSDPGTRPELHNCSGKHAGMLLACVRQGWDPGTYREPDHPLQQEVLAAVRVAAGEPRAVGVDGCGVPVHALTLAEMATLFARLSRPSAWGDLGSGAGRVVAAMRARPDLVAGRERADTALMRAVPGLVVKGGAEGLMCAVAPEAGLGVAVRSEDGSSRGAEPALLRTLRLLEVMDEAQEAAVAPHISPPVLGGGRPVGELRSDFTLDRS
jgi:L-asparaginase II